MRVPEKPAGGTLLFSAGADRRDMLPLGPQAMSLSPLQRSLSGGFTSFLAPPSPATTAAPTTAPPASQTASSSPSSASTSSPSDSVSRAREEEEEEEEEAADPQPVAVSLQPLVQSESPEAAAAGLSAANPANGSETENGLGQDALATAPRGDVTAGAEANRDTHPKTAAASQDTDGESEAEGFSGVAAPTAEIAPDTAAAQSGAGVDPSLTAEPALAAGLAALQPGKASRNSQQTPSDDHRGAAADTPGPVVDSADRPQENTTLADSAATNAGPRRGGRRGSSASGGREPGNARRADAAPGPSERTAQRDVAAAQTEPALGQAAIEAAQDSVIDYGAAPGLDLPAAAVPAAAGTGGGDTAAATSSTIDAASPVSASNTDAALDRSGERVTAQRADELSRTDVADRARLVHRIAKAMTKMGTDGGQVRMRMHPETLGSVLLEMRVRGRSVEARVTAANEAAIDLLRQQLPDLRQRLESQGMTVQRLDVELHEEGTGANSQSFDGQSRGGNPFGDEHSASGGSRGWREGPSPRADSVQIRALGAAAGRGRSLMSAAGDMLPAAPGTLDLSL